MTLVCSVENCGKPRKQAADAIVGVEADHFGANRLVAKRNRLAVLLDEPKLEHWYNEMVAEKEE